MTAPWSAGTLLYETLAESESDLSHLCSGKLSVIEVLHGLTTPMLLLMLQWESELVPNSPGSLAPMFCLLLSALQGMDRWAKIETLTQIKPSLALKLVSSCPGLSLPQSSRGDLKYFVLWTLITRITVNIFLISFSNLWTRLAMVYNFPPSQGFSLFQVWVFISTLVFSYMVMVFWGEQRKDTGVAGAGVLLVCVISGEQ